MKIIYLFTDAGRYHFCSILSLDSPAIHIPKDFKLMTCVLSSISEGTVLIQYSLATQKDIENDNAIWHDWSLGAVSSNVGLGFDKPISYLRAIAAKAHYTLELLI